MVPDVLVMTQDTLTYKLLVSKGRLRPEKVDYLVFWQDGKNTESSRHLSQGGGQYDFVSLAY